MKHPIVDIAAVNALLEPIDARLTQEFDRPRQPVVFLVEPGRSGSTFLTQVLMTQIRLGYVSNLLARFWLAPALGALLERDLVASFSPSSFVSKFGNTNGPSEPHEWGWFWRHWLRLGEGESRCRDEDAVDWAGLNRTLAALESIKGASLFFDNAFAQANIDLLHRHVPGVLAVRLTRDSYYVCNSHLNARVQRYGDLRSWYGIRPSNFDDLCAIADPVEQVVCQIKSILADIDAGLAKFAEADILPVDYSEIVADPRATAARYAAFIRAHGGAVDMRDAAPDLKFENSNESAKVDPAHRARLEGFYKDHFGSAHKIS